MLIGYYKYCCFFSCKMRSKNDVPSSGPNNFHVVHLKLLGKHLEFHFPFPSVFIYLIFTSFSGHRPAQREWAQTGLRSHSRCHPYPIPQPVKVAHTTGVYDP